MKPKVSVIIPVYNVEKYLSECLDSALNQTLTDLEIICVNDGSTDSSLSILGKYAAKDNRIVIINKENAGYGAAMNDGIRAASGEYVAFLESDDFIVSHAYEQLTNLADSYNLDIIKGNYFNYYGDADETIGEEKIQKIELTAIKERYNTVFRPLDNAWSFYIPMMNCLGLFRRDLIVRNNILHNETPGAAHQDMGFWFQTLCCANSMMLTDHAYYMYRQDNPNSSMKNDKTALLSLGEYTSMLEFLKRREGLMPQALPIYSHRKYGSCLFALENCELSLQLPFIRELSKTYCDEREENLLNLSQFKQGEKNKLAQIMDDPDKFYLENLDVYCESTKKSLEEMNVELERLRQKVRNFSLDSKTREVLSLTTSNEDEEYPYDISVIIPVYNAEKYLEECIQSVLDQPNVKIEVICVNDGSTDGSERMLNQFASADDRIKVFNQANKGQSAARNEAMRHAQGKYIAFLDSDDMLAESAFEKLLPQCELDQLDILYFDAKSVYDSPELEIQMGEFKNTYKRPKPLATNVTGEELFITLHQLKSYRVSPVLALYRRSYLRSIDAKFVEGIIYEDNIFTPYVMLQAKHVGHINEPYYIRRVRDNSTMTSSVNPFNVYSYFCVYQQLILLSTQIPLSIDAARGLEKELNDVLRTTQNHFNQLTTVQKRSVMSFPPIDRHLFTKLIADEGHGKSKHLEKYKAEIDRIRASNSWRIGRTVTYVPRLIKRQLKKSNKR